jgi:hypothetical protein
MMRRRRRRGDVDKMVRNAGAEVQMKDVEYGYDSTFER